MHGDEADVNCLPPFLSIEWWRQSVPEPGTRLFCLDTRLLGEPLSLLPSAGILGSCNIYLAFYVAAGDLNSGSHIYVASVLSTEPHPTHQSIRELSLDFFSFLLSISSSSSSSS